MVLKLGDYFIYLILYICSFSIFNYLFHMFNLFYTYTAKKKTS